MGKKHKKHKSDLHYSDESTMDKTPLKLVLKLGSEGMYDSDYAANSPASSHHEYSSHKPKKRKKKKHDKDNEEFIQKVSKKVVPDYVVDDVLVDEPSPKVAETEEDMEVQMILPAPEDTKVKVVKTRTLTSAKRKALNNLLEHLLKQLERKDTHDVFAWPVNDLIAPNYSSVINEPMDFSTMRNKIITDQYFDVNDFRRDFDLMIDNCCIYNGSDTVYHDIAKKVSAAGLKIMSSERLKNMRRSLNFLHDLSKHDLSDIFGFSVVEEESVDVAVDFETTSQTTVDTEEDSILPGEDNTDATVVEEHDMKAYPDAISFTDADTEDTVAPDAIQAMKNARKQLETKCPKNRMGFLRMDKDGKTTLNILNPDAGETVEREIDLGALTAGSISSGFDVMPEAKEDKRNKVTPLEYLSYGPFGSYAPTYDSRMSNLTQDESDLLLSAYGSDTGLLFAQSIEEFVSDSNKGLIRMVGDILDTVTHGAHSNAIEEIQRKRRKISADKNAKKTKSGKNVKINIDELKSLEDFGIDVSFLQEVEVKQRFGLKNEGKLIAVILYNAVCLSSFSYKRLCYLCGYIVH